MILANGRGGEIRTPDPLLPKQMRYQAALRPDTAFHCNVKRGNRELLVVEEDDQYPRHQEDRNGEDDAKGSEE
jgi:hypothetical protein